MSLVRKKENNSNIIGKLPPQAVDIEEVVLGSLMSDRNCIHEVITLISSDVFYKDAHAMIFSAIVNLYDANKPVDILTVCESLRFSGQLDLIGGPFYITRLTSRIASTANVGYHSLILLQKFIARRLIQYCNHISEQSYDDGQDVFELLDLADNELSKVNEISVRGGSMFHISDASNKAVKELQLREKQAKQGISPGITTGLHDLDKLTGGWQKSNLIILAARPGMGKTALMLHFAKAAANQKHHVCIFSLEMSDVSLANRLLLSSCNVNINNFKKGFMSESDWSEITSAKLFLDALPIYIDPNPVVTMRYIKSTCRIMKKKNQCDMIMIDYLQLADMSTSDKNRNREQEVAQASRMAKIISKELDVPVLLLSQLSRKVEDRKGSRPSLSDLRESGAIEQDADIVAFVYRPAYYDIEYDAKGNSTENVGEIILAKNRDGSTEDIVFKHNESMTKIYDYDASESLQFPSTTFNH